MLRASQIQAPDDFARVYAERGEAGIARMIVAAFDHLAASIDEATVAALIASNRYSDLWRHLALERLGPALRPALNRLAVVHDQVAIKETAVIGARPVSKARPSLLVTPDVINLTYDPLYAQTIAAQNAANQAVQQTVEQATERTAQLVISQGLTQRQTPAQIARTLRDTLGLTQQEANAIQSYRRALEQGGTAALSRKLRDPRYDKMVQRGGLTDEQINKMTARYADRYRAFRADRIARTEALRAANAGRLAAWKQYADRTGRNGADVRKFWLTASDERVCPVCRAIPVLNSDGVPMDESYDSPVGKVFTPPDPHPNCRCSERYETVAGTGNQRRPSAGAGVAGIRIELDYAPEPATDRPSAGALAVLEREADIAQDLPDPRPVPRIPAAPAIRAEPPASPSPPPARGILALGGRIVAGARRVVDALSARRALQAVRSYFGRG